MKKQEKQKTTEKNDLEVRSKYFKTNNSLYTDLYEDKDKRALANLIIATVIAYLGYIAIGDVFYNTGNQFGLKLILTSFPNFGSFILLWIVIFLSTLVLFLALQFWGRLRIYLPPKSTFLKFWDVAAITGYASFWFITLSFTAYVTLTGQIQNLCSLSFQLETFRMLAKTHACVRDAAAKMMKNKLKSKDSPYFPAFSNFVYFMFCPTLIYSDAYPRLKVPVRWKLVVELFIHILVSIILCSCVLDNTALSELIKYETLNFMDVILLSFKYQWVMLILIFASFYIVFHCLQHIFAEILGFPFREFYLDWWCSTNFVQFFYKWNVFVRDWFYVYVYLEVYRNLTNKNKFFAKYAVFLLSAVFHEMFMSFTSGYCLPIVFIEYFVLVSVVSLIRIKDDRWSNIFFWISLSMGMSVVMITHILETLARMKCPIENATVLTFFTPRMLSCYR